MRALPDAASVIDVNGLRTIIAAWLEEIVSYRREVETALAFAEELKTRNITPEEKLNYFHRVLYDKANLSIEKWKVLQKFSKPTLKKIAGFYNRSKLTIGNVQQFSEIFLEEYFRILRVHSSEVSDLRINSEAVRHLSNVAVSVYIERWLEKTPSCKGTINSLYEDGYKLKTDTQSWPQDYRDALVLAYEKYEDFIQIAHNQRYQETGIESRKVKKTKTGRRLNFVALEWCRASSLGALRILERLYSNHYINRESEHNAAQNKALATDCQRFYSYIEELSALYSTNNAYNDPHNTRIFVLGNILLQKTERIHRFNLVNLYSHWNLLAEDAKMPFATELAQLYWGRYSEDPGLLFNIKSSLENKDGKKVLHNDSFDILSYKEQIKKIYAIQSPEEYAIESTREALMRRAMIDIMLTLHTVFPIEQAKAWDQNTFNDAAQFYCQDYKIIDSFTEKQPFSFSSEQSHTQAHRYYNCFHSIYCKLYDSEDSPLLRGHDEFRELRKKRKDTKHRQS